jgi:hypothetical protein
MELVYLVNKPQVSRRIARWLLLFLEYNFVVVYKPCIVRLLDTTTPIGVPDQTIDVSLFYIEPKWLTDVKDFLRTR